MVCQAGEAAAAGVYQSSSAGWDDGVAGMLCVGICASRLRLHVRVQQALSAPPARGACNYRLCRCVWGPALQAAAS